jgi:ABC-type multidrug transport system fused ATPase/permease subunit
VVGELGKALSGGQFLPVLNESASTLAIDREKAIRDNLVRIKAGRTMVIIAHKLSTVLACDRILVLSEGRIVEDGSPKALLAQGGVFAGMMRGQG